ncbi:hypothetical protein PISMIDRAFT_18319 [Pisolithus microcarpus 441]|uniref:Uncharacterized protein n=1 Tax=Pisolithus microcarpus 441 TaxID=765257 RepID=A0A0C9YGE9_9AGAM|nr:hypothetical protein PISMIDRAFT_18319 [Pisolithus microcarpus 441]
MSTPDIVGAQASLECIQHTVDAAQPTINGNYLGPPVASVTFIPLLTYTSPSPMILLLSSIAVVIPPPTWSIYASTKCASLMLFQALQIDLFSINFAFVLPATIEGNFRASPVDNPPNWTGAPKVHEDDPNKNGLKAGGGGEAMHTRD